MGIESMVAGLVGTGALGLFDLLGSMGIGDLASLLGLPVSPWPTYGIWFLLVAAGYLLGSVPTGLIVGRLVKGIDIRKFGSGKVGATNSLRTLGAAPSAVVFAGDVGKAAIMVLVARWVGAPTTIQTLAGVAAVAGHCWSAYIAFGGGRGVASSLGAVLAISPVAALIGLAAAIGVAARTRYMSLGSLVGTALGTLTVLGMIAVGWLGPGYAVLTVAAVIVFVKHQDNIQRLLAGTERKLGEKSKNAETSKLAVRQATVDHGPGGQR